MAVSRYRVIQWATGNTGLRALREVIRDPSLDLVGVRVYDVRRTAWTRGGCAVKGIPVSWPPATGTPR
jgi:hypothetical protein